MNFFSKKLLFCAIAFSVSGLNAGGEDQAFYDFMGTVITKSSQGLLIFLIGYMIGLNDKRFVRNIEVGESPYEVTVDGDVLRVSTKKQVGAPVLHSRF